MKKIIVTIDEEGNASVETKGFHGPTCKDASAFLENALGQKKADRTTAEHHTKPTTQNNTNINQ